MNPSKNYQNSQLAATLLCAAALVLFPFTAMTAEKAVDKPLEKVRVAYSAISGSQVVAWVAHEYGFFRKNGLDVELIFIEGGPRAVQSLIAREVTFAQVAGNPVIQRNLQGVPVVMVAGFMNTLDYQFVVDKNITRPDQLKGKAVAVSQPGSASDFAMRYALDKYGLQPGKDVTLVEIGSQPARFAALETGKIQGVMVAVPLTLKAKKMGFNILADLQMLGLEFQYSGIAVTQDLIKSRPDLVSNFVKACVEAIHFFKTHRKEGLEILRKYMKSDDIEALTETYEAIGLTLIPEKPYPTVRGFQIMLHELAAKDPKAGTAKPEQFVNLNFVRELDKSGYIDRLYKTTPVPAQREEPRQVVTAPDSARKEKAAEKAKSTSEKKRSVQERKGEAIAKAPLGPGGEKNDLYEHTVKAGETLSHLALRYYGRANEWPKIYDANKETLKNPHYIYIGQKILVPDANVAA